MLKEFGYWAMVALLVDALVFLALEVCGVKMPWESVITSFVLMWFGCFAALISAVEVHLGRRVR